MTLPYKAVEHPQAFAHAAALTQMAGATWEIYQDGEISLLYQSGDAAGQGVTTNGSTITFAEPGVYVLRCSCAYTADAEGTPPPQGTITIDDSTLDSPTEQAIAEGAQFTEHTSAKQPLAFDRTINVDSTLTVGLWVDHLPTSETQSIIDITSLTIEVERVGEPSYPLPGFWNVNASDLVVQANLQESGLPVVDGDEVETIIRREGAGDWTQVTVAQQATYEVDGYNSILPGLSLVGADPNWYQLDAQASQFNGDPSFCYFEVFDCAAVSDINMLLEISASATEYCRIFWSSGTSLAVQRRGTSGPQVQSGSGLVVGRNWIAVSRNGATGGVDIWVNSLTPALSGGVLGGGTFNPTLLTLGTQRDSPTFVPSTRIIRRTHLAVNKTFSQSHVARMVEMSTRWGEV